MSSSESGNNDRALPLGGLSSSYLPGLNPLPGESKESLALAAFGVLAIGNRRTGESGDEAVGDSSKVAIRESNLPIFL